MYLNYTEISEDKKSAKMYILDQIGRDPQTGRGVDGETFCRELMYVSDTLGVKDIDILINSVGGSVLDAYSIFSAIMLCRTKPNTINAGLCASAAGLIFQAGKVRKCMDYALFMTHEAQGIEAGEVKDKFNSSLRTILLRKSTIAENDLIEMMKKTTWMDAEECKNLGLCDEVVDSSKMNIPRLSKSQDVESMYNQATLICNKVYFNKQVNIKQMSFDKVYNKLNLEADSSQERVLEAIGSIEKEKVEISNKLVVEVQNSKELSEKLQSLNDALKSKDEKISSLTNQVDVFVKEKEEREAEILQKEATQLVNEAVRVGRIKNDADMIAKWVKNAVDNFDGVKEMIEAIPINKKMEATLFKPKDNDQDSNINWMAAKKNEISNKFNA